MDKREVYILSGLHKVTNVISKKLNYKGQKVTKPQPVFLYNRNMSGVDLILCALLEHGYTQCTHSPQEIFIWQTKTHWQFSQYYSFLHKSVKWSKKFFVHCLNMVILNAHILHKKYSYGKQKHTGSSGEN